MKTIHVTLSFAVQVPANVTTKDITFSVGQNQLLAHYQGNSGGGESAGTGTFEARITAEVYSACTICHTALTEQEQGWGNSCQQCEQQAAEAQRREKNWQRGQWQQQEAQR